MTAVVRDAGGERAFAEAEARVYASDPRWTPPLPGELRETFDPRINPALAGSACRRWVLFEGEDPCGRIAAFAPADRPSVGYVGFVEFPNDAAKSRALFAAAEEWLLGLGRRDVYGPVAVTPRDRIGLLVEAFDRPAVLFTPYNPPYYPGLFEAAGYVPAQQLRAYGWEARTRDAREVARLADRLVNCTLAGAWHYDPIGADEADRMARLLEPVLEPRLALIAEDADGPCAVALAVPDAWWVWRRAGARLWPLGWARMLSWRRRIPQVRVMAFGVLPRARGTGAAALLLGALERAGRAIGYRYAELSQVYDDNAPMRRVLDPMGLPVVRRYAVYHRRLGR
ncbi:MAG: GNAT family N-acetyltransferase [Gemmatimonadales bacterium]